MRIFTPVTFLATGYFTVACLVSVRIIDSHLKEEEQWTGRVTSQVSTSRVPEYEFGTEEYSRRCGWNAYRGNTENCTFLSRPAPNSTEGISHWVAQVVSAYLLAQQAGCNIIFDYGPGIDISQVMSLNSHDWTVPDGYDCRLDPRCFQIDKGHPNRMDLDNIAQALDQDEPLAAVPHYRFAYLPTKTLCYHLFTDLQRKLPGFQAESGMACSLATLFHLNPSSSRFEPELFSRILPTLQRKDALVISLYIRTGQTEVIGAGTSPMEGQMYHRNRAASILACALEQEKERLGDGVSRVVWMVVTDSQYLRHWITESYDTTQSKSNITREIVTTTSRGAHTKLERGPSNADFAEAFIDWYLIGESDLVVTDQRSPSFGGTAALRTARPLYDATHGTCVKFDPVHETSENCYS